MSASALTVVKMIESLPDSLQERLVEHLREYLLDMQDELKWDKQLKKTQKQLAATSRRAKKESAKGFATSMDFNRL